MIFDFVMEFNPLCQGLNLASLHPMRMVFNLVLLIGLNLSLQARAAAVNGESTAPASPSLLPIDFDLRSLPNTNEKIPRKNCYGPRQDSLKVLSETFQDPRLPESMRPKAKITKVTTDKNGRVHRDSVYVFPAQDGDHIATGEEPRIMGMTSTQALRASRDARTTNTLICTPAHEQGDMANRWCHSAVSQTFADFLEQKGVSPTAASLAGGLFWAPKEFLMDLNPSASDLTLTYRDRLRTKRSTFEVTVFGDAVFDNHMTKFKLGSGSSPMLTWKRRLGPAERD